MDNQRDMQSIEDGIVPYSLHVSARYLELTKRKLELTRLPREVKLPKEREWFYGTPKSALEPLIDFWLDGYSWREHEESLNQELPQFRTAVSYTDKKTNQPESIRLHFVHKRSIATDAIPLLYCHGWPGCFLEVHKMIGSLSSPIPTHLHPPEESPSFHVVAPNIPGFGFSDASGNENFGLRQTADVFDGLMNKLGYHHYVVCGSNWGFEIARSIAVTHPSSCSAILTTTSSTSSPQQSSSNRRLAHFSFFNAPTHLPTPTFHDDGLFCLSRYHQTNSYALCDSPAGLLAAVLHHLYTSDHLHIWSPTDVLTWTMLLWLPGPEAPLRWLHNAKNEFSTWQRKRSIVPLGVHVYHAPEGPQEHKESTWRTVGRGGGLLANLSNVSDRLGQISSWLTGSRSELAAFENVQRVAWVKKSTGTIGIPSWDAAGDLVLSLRAFCAKGLKEGWLDLKGHEPEQKSEDKAQEQPHHAPSLKKPTPAEPSIPPPRSGHLSWLWFRRRRKPIADEESQRGPNNNDDDHERQTLPETPLTTIAARPSTARPVTANNDSTSLGAHGLGILDIEERRPLHVDVHESHPSEESQKSTIDHLI